MTLAHQLSGDESNVKRNESTSPVASNNPMEQAALDYLSLGWSILPIKPGDKTPARDLLPEDANGEKRWSAYRDRRAARSEVRGWFLENPTINVAVICGEASGNLVVVDVDKPELASHLHLPPTVSAKTARGAHYYYISDKPIPSAKLPWGEIRSNGNYTCLPPSVHPSGVRYEWSDFCSPFEHEFAKFPSSLFLVAEGDSVSLSSREVDKKEYSSLHTCTENPESETEATVSVEANSVNYNLIDWMRRGDVAIAILKACGAKYVRWNEAKGSSNAFKCILPGHRDGKPSSSLVRCGEEDTRKKRDGKANAGVILYRDWHTKGYTVQDESGNEKTWFQEWYTLGEVYAAVKSGQLTRLGPGEKAIWTYRALIDLGYLKVPAVLNGAKLPDDAKPIVREVYEGFKTLIAARLLYDSKQAQAAPYSHRFAAMWTGRSVQHCGTAVKWLIDNGYLRVVKKGSTAKASLLEFGRPRAKGEGLHETPS